MSVDVKDTAVSAPIEKQDTLGSVVGSVSTSELVEANLIGYGAEIIFHQLPSPIDGL